MATSSYDNIYDLYAWQDNNRTFMVTTGEGGLKQLRFALKDKRGMLDINASGDDNVYYAVTRPDGEPVLIAGDIATDGTSVSFKIESSLTAVKGIAKGEVRLTNSAGTIKFYGVNLCVLQGVSDDATEKSEQFSALIEALQKLASVTADGEVTKLDTEIKEGGINPVTSGVLYEYLINNYLPSIGTLINPPTSATVGRKKQLAVKPNESDDGYDLYICMGQNDDGTYKWVQVAKDVVDLSDYVAVERTIAGLDLSSDISVESLLRALSVYPLANTTSSLSSTNIGQLEYLSNSLSKNKGLHVLVGKDNRKQILTAEDNIDNSPNANSYDSKVVGAKAFYYYFKKLLSLSNKQLCTTPIEWEQCGLINADGTFTGNALYARTVDYIDISALDYPVTIKTSKDSNKFRAVYYNDDDTFVSMTGATSALTLNPAIAPKVKIFVNTYNIVDSGWNYTLDDVVNTISVTLNPILYGDTTPPSSTTIGTEKTIYLCKIDGKYKLYQCYGVDENGYVWNSIVTSDDLTEYVEKALISVITQDKILSSFDPENINEITNEQIVGAKLFVDKMNGLVKPATKNLFEYDEDNLRAGYSPRGNLTQEILDNLEFNSETTDSVEEYATRTLYKKIIPINDGGTYAVTKGFRGLLRFYNKSGQALAVLGATETNHFLEGETCDYFTVPTVENHEMCYMSLAFRSDIDCSSFYLSKGDEIRESNTLNDDIKVSYSQLYGSPNDGDNNKEDTTTNGNNAVGGVAYLYYEELSNYASLIQDKQSPTTLTLALMADTHYCDNNANAQDKLNTANKMALLSNYVHIDAIANLGDFVAGNEPKDITRTDLAKLIVNTNQNAKCPVFYVRGNHDDNGWYSRDNNGGTRQPDEIFDDKEWYQLAFGFSAKDLVTDVKKPQGGYGYYDHDASKIRVFILNTSDFPYTLKEDGTYRYDAYGCAAFSNEQINFVANALKFEDKDNPNEWAAMFLMHVPMDTVVDDGVRFGAPNAPIRGYIQMLSIIDSYRKGISYSFDGYVNDTSKDHELAEDFPVNVSVDYTKKGCGDVICFVSGHTHIDNASKKVGYEYNLSYGYTYLSFIGSTCFATVVIDREQSVANVFKYGWALSPSQSTDPVAEGIIDGEKEIMGIDEEENNVYIDISSGIYTVPFEQFRPTGENIYNGISEVTGDGYFVDNSVSIDLKTLELPSATENSEYIITKAILLRQNTKYIIPNIGDSSSIRVYHPKTGTPNGSLTPKAFGENEQIFKSAPRGCYVVFNFCKKDYSDYENFYIKEYVSEIGDTES